MAKTIRAPEPVDWIGIIEALYAIEQPREPWLEGVLRAAAPLTSSARVGVGGILYDITGPSAPRLDFITGLDVPPAWIEMGIEGHTNPSLAPALVHNSRKCMCASSREYIATFGSQAKVLSESMASVGLRETIG